MSMPIAEAIAVLQEIAAKHPRAVVRGDTIDMQVSCSTDGLTVEVAVTDADTERALEFAADFNILAGGNL